MRKLLSLTAMLVLSCLGSSAWALAPVSFFPTSGATTACADSKLQITFDTTPTLGVSGTIRIYTASGNTLVKTINAASNIGTKTVYDTPENYYPILVVGKTAWIDPGNSFFAYNTAYYVQIDSTVFSGYAGISTTTGWTFTTKASAPSIGTTINVSADGSGDFATVQGALEAVPTNNSTPRTINISAGNFVEQIVDKARPFLTLQGAGRANTIIQYPNNNTFQGLNGNSASTTNRHLMRLQSDDTTIRDLTIYNTTPVNGSQAEALMVNGSVRVVVRDCDIKSYQDTLLMGGRVYCYNLYVEGDVDYIWGGGTVFFDTCTFKTMRNGYLVQARNNSGQAVIPGGPFGYVFVDCSLIAAPGVTSLYFNRIDPGAFPYSNVAMINCVMDSFVNSAGWLLNTTPTAPNAGFWEYKSVDPLGKPIDTSSRLATYSRQLNDTEAATLRDPKNVVGIPDNWNPKITVGRDSAPIGFAAVNALGQNGTTGGAGGTTVTVSNQADLTFYAGQAAPYIIQVSGKITITPFAHMIDVNSDKTIIGLNGFGQLENGGLNLDTKKNIIIRDLSIGNSYIIGDFDGKTSPCDGISIRASHHVWIDHCDVHHCADGMIDLNFGSPYVTISWSVLSLHNKASIMGGTGVRVYSTVHHCWFINNNQRNTRNQNATVHHFNNYWSGINFYCNNAIDPTQVLVENSYFKKAGSPYGPDATNPGDIEGRGNLLYSTTGNAVSTTQGLTMPYAYSMDPAANVPILVQKYAGPRGNVYSDNLAKTVKVAFRPSGKTQAYGYLEDNGGTYANHAFGINYGWDASNAANAFWRENIGSDHVSLTPTEEDMRKNGGIIFGARKWELGLANGSYSVKTVCGDPWGPPYTTATVTAVNTINVEGATLTDPDGASDFDDFTTTVSVSDGKLTVQQDAGATAARINFIEVTPLSLVTPTPTPTPTPSVITVSKGGVSADIMNGAVGLNNAIPSAADGSTFRVIESGDYPVATTIVANSSASRANLRIEATVPNVRFVSSGAATPISVSTTGGPFNLALDSVQFIGDTASTAHAFQITQNTNTAYGTTITLNNCRIEQLNTVAAASGVIFTGAASTANLVDANTGSTITLIATNTLFRSRNNNQRAAIDLRATNCPNVRMTLTGCQLYNDGSNLASNGVICLDNNAGYYYHINLTNCSLFNNSTNQNRACINVGGSGAARFAHSEINCTSTSFTSPYTRAFMLSPPGNPDTTNNVGDVRVTFNRCIFDNHNETLASGVIGSSTYPQYSATLNFSFANGGTMLPSTIGLFNSLILSPQDDPASPGATVGQTGARGIAIAGTVALTAYGNTLVSQNGIGNGGIGTPNSTPTYVAKNNLFFNYKAPISGSTSAATQQSASPTLIGGATNTRNEIVGLYDDADVGSPHYWYNVASPVLGTDELATNYHPRPGSLAALNADPSSQITAVAGSLDLEGVTRNASTPTIGAYENLATPVELSHFSVE